MTTLECKQSFRLGMENGEILDSQISASSGSHEFSSAASSRLNWQKPGWNSAWSPGNKDNNPWLQVDLGLQDTITEILTQGHSRSYEWVKTYTVSYSNDGLNFFAYRVDGVVKVRILLPFCSSMMYKQV